MTITEIDRLSGLTLTHPQRVKICQTFMLCHALNDADAARVVRDEIEALGFKPIAAIRASERLVTSMRSTTKE